MKSVYKIESKRPSGRYILAFYNELGILEGLKLCGEGWNEEMVKIFFGHFSTEKDLIENSEHKKLTSTKL